jgi:hypothetical protein
MNALSVTDIRQNNKFRREIESVIKRHSGKNVSNPLDFILAEYLTNCLATFDAAVRERRYGLYPDGGCPPDTAQGF